MINKRRVIVVLGMHRSGTSAIARGLATMGAVLGDNLMPAAANNNEKGFYEDLDIYTLNVELLNQLGHEWDSLLPIESSVLVGEDVAPFKKRAIALLHQKLAGANVFGMKDPRICRLLPFWKSVFDSAHVEAGYVIALRHPLSVAHSLKKRDGFEVEKSMYLWLYHAIPSILQSSGSARIVVNYDLLLERPEEQIYRIASALHLPVDRHASEISEYTNEFLENRMRHSCFKKEDLEMQPEVIPKAVAEAYSVLDMMSRDVLCVDAPEVLDCFEDLDNRLKDSYPLFSLIAKGCHRINVLELSIAEKEKQIFSLQEANAELKNENDTMVKSRSWRLTAPLRKMYQIVRSPLSNRN